MSSANRSRSYGMATPKHLFARGRTREIRAVARQDYGHLLSNLQRAVDRDV